MGTQQSSFWRKIVPVVGASLVRRLMRFYPPFLGAGIRLTRVDRDYRAIDVEMPLTALNKNYVGTHFGGSLYAMCDPFFMLMIMENLGPGYVVWDKSATIEFIRPGEGTVKAQFRLEQSDVQRIKGEADSIGKSYPNLSVNIINENEEIVARVQKLLSVRKKQ